MDIIAYPITSHGIWRFIPHRDELSHNAAKIEGMNLSFKFISFISYTTRNSLKTA